MSNDRETTPNISHFVLQGEIAHDKKTGLVTIQVRAGFDEDNNPIMVETFPVSTPHAKNKLLN